MIRDPLISGQDGWRGNKFTPPKFCIWRWCPNLRLDITTRARFDNTLTIFSKMAPYDSDSSGAEDDDFTETNVLLGYASTDANGEEISRLGGYPVCRPRLTDPLRMYIDCSK